MENADLKQVLKKNLEVSEESLKILKKMHRTQKFHNFFTLLKWTVVIGLTLGTYYYIQPFIKTLYDTISQIKKDFGAMEKGADSIKSIPNFSPEILPQGILDQVQNFLNKQTNH